MVAPGNPTTRERESGLVRDELFKECVDLVGVVVHQTTECVKEMGWVHGNEEHCILRVWKTRDKYQCFQKV